MLNTILAIVAVIAIGGQGTRYDDPFVGRPLFCSPPKGPDLIYTKAQLQATPWVAMPVGGLWACRDPILVVPTEWPETAFVALALDAGPFAGYYADGRPIVVDVPTGLAPWAPNLSAPVSVVNLAHVAAQLAKVSTCGEARARAIVLSWAKTGRAPDLPCLALAA